VSQTPPDLRSWRAWADEVAADLTEVVVFDALDEVGMRRLQHNALRRQTSQMRMTITFAVVG
jgi:hypothetical protein